MSYQDFLASRGYRRVTVWRSTIDGVQATPAAEREPGEANVLPMRKRVQHDR